MYVLALHVLLGLWRLAQVLHVLVGMRLVQGARASGGACACAGSRAAAAAPLHVLVDHARVLVLVLTHAHATAARACTARAALRSGGAGGGGGRTARATCDTLHRSGLCCSQPRQSSYYPAMVSVPSLSHCPICPAPTTP